MEGKVCTKCGEWKEYSEFYKSKAKKDGYQSNCKECGKKYYRDNEERYREHNKNNKHLRKQYLENNKEKVAEQKKRYYEKHKEKLNAYGKEYREANKKSINERNRKYNQTESGREANYRKNLKRRSYKHKVKFTPHQRKGLLERDDWTCQCCGKSVHDEHTGNWNTHDKAHIDHIIPISKGGTSDPSNLQVLCRTCNLSKQDKLNMINSNTGVSYAG